MVLAFVFIGMGTSSMYFAGVTTSAKNFTGNRGLALSLPIAAFGLSSLWQSQVVSRVFTDKTTGELGISTIFLAYAVFLLVIGILGALGLKVIKSAEEISRTGERESLLEGGQRSVGASYGTTVQEAVDEQVPEKRPLINKATWEFLTDNNMWFFAAGVFLVTGPGEAFINNMGTLITTLYPPPSTASQIRNPIDPATHVSIVAATSTIARVVAGILSDYLAPPVPTSDACPPPPPRKFPRCSRMCLLFLFAFLMLLGNLYVSLGYVQENGENFWIVSSSIGAGYGAVFCLAPTVVSVVWGTENFGTNWGIVTMTPAVGATVFGSIFAWGYDHYADKNGICWGEDCYSASFMVMVVSVACALVGWSIAWKGPSGWSARGITV
ncbi:MFS general substrate transporter [Choiromyces venosus 120613-1]|uniref:Probable transporter MCH1 n=1 Tax=Choiromyces venosus 120613-1 TaxID=1336337 RepID=A0A3N4J5K5_9PEZI|nr:MFS general substrate transporter [Choiromyces venosus 120613-1]